MHSEVPLILCVTLTKRHLGAMCYIEAQAPLPNVGEIVDDPHLKVWDVHLSVLVVHGCARLCLRTLTHCEF